VQTRTLWRCSVRAAKKTIKPRGTIYLRLAANGQYYTIAVRTRLKASAAEMANAMRAATAHYINMAGGDMAVVGAESLKDTTFDTGDQRAN
jgi:hypothetical protein